jgi:two-component system nitrogen regulation sensor histidine kinase NtrY
MDSLANYHRASAIGWRLLIAAAATTAALATASSGHFATAFLLALAALLALLDIAVSTVRPAVRQLLPSADIGAAAEVDRLRALLDAVSTALFVIDAQGRILLTNRAGRRLAGTDIARIDDIEVLGLPAITTIRALPPGARRIVHAGDGRSLFVWSGAFAVSGEAPQRLLSLQWVAGELDAVETEAWHAMTRVLTHEMMNSLTPIVSLAESVAELPERDKAVAPALATIARRAMHLLSFIERFRAIGSLPSPTLSSIDLATLLADIVATVKPEFAAIGIEVALRADKSFVTIMADHDLLERAILNLLRNAADALQGKKQARVDVELVVMPSGITIAICDNGPGIGLERLNDIFVPFFSTKPNGSGIGLPLARQIASSHGGTLIAKPMAQGSCFELHLPINAVPSMQGRS